MGDSPSGAVGIPDEEPDGDIGTPDVDVMTDIRVLFLDEEPLAETYAWNDPIDKRELHIYFSGGSDADWSRLDVTWYTSEAYRFHDVDGKDQHWWFDRHPNDHSGEKHFHEPPDADSRAAVSSCIQVEEPGLVARAVRWLWRRAVVTGAFDELNHARNPHNPPPQSNVERARSSHRLTQISPGGPEPPRRSTEQQPAHN